MIRRKDYIEAMRILDKEGWRRGWYHGTEGGVAGPHCVLGALGKASGNHHAGCPLVDWAHAKYPTSAKFNDHPQTTYTYVLTLLAFGAAGAFED